MRFASSRWKVWELDLSREKVCKNPNFACWFDKVIQVPLYKLKKLRSNHWRCSVKKGVLKNFTKFTGKHLCQSLYFNKVACLRPATLLKNRFWHRWFPVNFAKFLRTPFLRNISGRLLLLFPLLRNLLKLGKLGSDKFFMGTGW